MGTRLLITIMSVTRQTLTGLVLAGLLLVPVTCSLVGHPHSLFDMPGERPSTRTHAVHTSHASHTGGASESGAILHTDTRPPLAALPVVPGVHPGTITGWLADRAGETSRAIPAASELPAVTTTAMVMVASSLSALHVTLLALLVAVLVATRPLAGPRTLTGRTTRVPAPPPRLLSPS